MAPRIRQARSAIAILDLEAHFATHVHKAIKPMQVCARRVRPDIRAQACLLVRHVQLPLRSQRAATMPPLAADMDSAMEDLCPEVLRVHATRVSPVRPAIHAVTATSTPIASDALLPQPATPTAPVPATRVFARRHTPERTATAAPQASQLADILHVEQCLRARILGPAIATARAMSTACVFATLGLQEPTVMHVQPVIAATLYAHWPPRPAMHMAHATAQEDAHVIQASVEAVATSARPGTRATQTVVRLHFPATDTALAQVEIVSALQATRAVVVIRAQ